MHKRYQPKNKLRIITSTSLFDGHDVAINIMRRILQDAGCEVVHLGHNRSAEEIVRCAIQEDAHAIAVTSYQGGHLEFFKYLFDLLRDNASGHIKIFGGGGGTIHPDEIKELHAYGICRIYSPDDGRSMGLEGMIDDLLEKADHDNTGSKELEEGVPPKGDREIARWITLGETNSGKANSLSALYESRKNNRKTPVLGITGTGGAGKSSVVDELVRRFLNHSELDKVAILSVDPTKRKTGGALLGDRIRMNAINDPRVYMRSMATRQADLALSQHVGFAVKVLALAGFELIILETSGIGQSDTEIVDFSDLSLYVMTPEYGAASQLEKIDMLDFADFIAINKFDKQGSEDALRDVKKQYRRNHHLWEEEARLPVFGTIASQFNDEGIDRLYFSIMDRLERQFGLVFSGDSNEALAGGSTVVSILPGSRIRYLSEIVENNRSYDDWAKKQKRIAQQLYALSLSIRKLKDLPENYGSTLSDLEKVKDNLASELDPSNKTWLENWPDTLKAYSKEKMTFKVREKDLEVKTFATSLSGTRVPKVALPKYEAWGDLLHWHLQENLPGSFPFTAGVFPFKREHEDPTRMFAGEGGPERTNKRFHYLSKGMPAARLSTAFDSVSLYGEDPATRPDIFGKIGNSGVSICSLDDAKKLYSGFDLSAPTTSVSMTINGPAAIFTAFFLNAAVDQQCELYIVQNGLEEETRKTIKQIFEKENSVQPSYIGNLPEGNNGLGLMLLGLSGDRVLPTEVYQKIKQDTLKKVRGTVQADILKEDQAQNTCIFSTGFSLKLMGDVQQYFVDQQIRNFYSVSISGYHIAEAGANPITQLALTLSNGFTYVEYFLSRGMHIDDFAPNLSFFFSNGIDAEYAVIGRVARKIWAKAIKFKYKGNARSQLLKYHIQTSGRSLHAQEVDFNDIRTTLQALYAIYDNCNSLHTNAYDEAITTPTEASVRRALAIQLIINKELGLAKNENPIQGSFIIEELTDLVEEAIYLEFERISERGGVLGAMETMYQRAKIQEESMHFEHLKHRGTYPIIGVNTFLSSAGSPTLVLGEVIRSDHAEKINQIKNLEGLHALHREKTSQNLHRLQLSVVQNNNVFETLMEAVKYCSLGQLTQALYAVGGKYRRNM
jgi:isobutyryl-CoA mutase